MEMVRKARGRRADSPREKESRDPVPDVAREPSLLVGAGTGAVAFAFARAGSATGGAFARAGPGPRTHEARSGSVSGCAHSGATPEPRHRRRCDLGGEGRPGSPREGLRLRGFRREKTGRRRPDVVSAWFDLEG